MNNNNSTIEQLYDALADNDTTGDLFDTEEIKASFNEVYNYIIETANIHNVTIEDNFCDKLNHLCSLTSRTAFEVGFTTAMSLATSTSKGCAV